MSDVAIIATVVAALAAVLALVAPYKLQRRKERREDTQPAQDLLRQIAVAVRGVDPPDSQAVARFSTQLGEIEVDAPEDVQPSLARVRERLDSYGAVCGAALAGPAGTRPGPSPSSVLGYLMRAIDKAREDIQRYRDKG